MNLMDLFIISFIIFGCFYGYRKGLFKTIMGLIGYGVSLLFSLMYYKQFGQFIDKTFSITDKLMPQLKESISLPANLSAVQIKDLPVNQIATKINQFEMPDLYKQEMLEFLRNLSEQGNNPNVQNLGDGILSLIATIIINGISVVVLCMIVERLFAFLANIIAKKKGFSLAEKIDRWIGAGIGGITNFVMVVVLLIIATPILAFGQSAATPDSPVITIANQISNSSLAQIMMSIIQGVGFNL